MFTPNDAGHSVGVGLTQFRRGDDAVLRDGADHIAEHRQSSMGPVKVLGERIAVP